MGIKLILGVRDKRVLILRLLYYYVSKMEACIMKISQEVMDQIFSEMYGRI